MELPGAGAEAGAEAGGVELRILDTGADLEMVSSDSEAIEFMRISHGICSDYDGYSVITDPDRCTEAGGASFSWNPGRALDTTSSSRQAGCYYKVSSYALWFNDDITSGVPSDSARQHICEKTTPAQEFKKIGKKEEASQKAEIEKIGVTQDEQAEAPTPPLTEWDLVIDGHKCTEQVFRKSYIGVYDCEQLAIQRNHSFYQYHAGKGKCVTEKACLNPIEAVGWAVYRDNELWPLKETSQSCTGKAKNKKKAATQMECQQAALDRPVSPATFYTWNAEKKQCRVSTGCTNKPAGENFATYRNPHA